MTISVEAVKKPSKTEWPAGRRFFTANLHLGDKHAHRALLRPENSDEIILDNINRTLSDGDFLFILGGLFSRSDRSSGFAQGSVWLDPDFDVHDRLELIDRINPLIEKVFVYGTHDDETLAEYFNRFLQFRFISPVVPLVIGNREVLLAASSAYAAADPGVPVICGSSDPDSGTGAEVVEVGVDRNNLMPFSEGQVVEALRKMMGSSIHSTTDPATSPASLSLRGEP